MGGVTRDDWVAILTEALRQRSGHTIGVTLRSSVRFAGRVTSVKSQALVLIRESGGHDRLTYVDYDEVAAIEFLS